MRRSVGTSLVVGLVAAAAAAAMLSGAVPPFASTLGTVLDQLPDLSLAAWPDHWNDAINRLIRGYSRTPEMVLGLGLALGLPLLALASNTARALLRWHQRRERGRRHSIQSQAKPMPRPHGRAWLECVDDGRHRDLELATELTRIGRDVENEFPINHQYVDQFHALIRRTPEAEYQIVDVSSRTGAGLTINGQKIASSRLQDGDRIGLGPMAVTFRRFNEHDPVIARTSRVNSI